MSSTKLFDTIVDLGRKTFVNSPFISTSANSQIYPSDVQKVLDFLSQVSKYSETWNGSTTRHIRLAYAIADRLSDELGWTVNERSLVCSLTAVHDIGRLITNEIIVSEEVGLEMLRSFGWSEQYVGMLFGWGYWSGEEYVAGLRSARDRVFFLSDVFGKPSNTGSRIVRTSQEVFYSICSLPQRYEDCRNQVFKNTVDMVVRRCCDSVESGIAWVESQNVNFDQLLSNIELDN